MKLFKSIDLRGYGKKYEGKVRDVYVKGDKRILITTDRISAFDRNLGYIPHKGQVLNLLAAFWFEKTHDIIQNHLIEVIDPNVTIAKNCTLIPIEMVVRGYISGVTGTSIWGSYQKGERVIYGIQFPDGLKKNQNLPTPVITPTTKAEIGHDERLTREEAIEKTRLLMPGHSDGGQVYSQMEKAALALFERGTTICNKAGIILVDTKYEFGLYNGHLMLIDEIHTPDSSRFWIKATYKQRFSSGEEPENFDKEFVRLWFKKKGYVGEGTPPRMPKSFVEKVSKRYRDIYEMITDRKLKIDRSQLVERRIKENIDKYFGMSS